MVKAGDEEYNRALDALEAGNLVESLEAVESALMSDARDSGYWQLYALLLTQVGRAEDSARAKAKVDELGLDKVDSLLMKAAEAGAEQSWNKAVTACEQALEIAPERGEVWGSYAFNLISGGYKSDALEASLKAVTLSPKEPQFWYLRGRVLRLNSQSGEALVAYEKALALDPKLSLAWYEMGMVYHQQGDREQAHHCFAKAETLKPGDPEIQEALKIVLAN